MDYIGSKHTWLLSLLPLLLWKWDCTLGTCWRGKNAPIPSYLYLKCLWKFLMQTYQNAVLLPSPRYCVRTVFWSFQLSLPEREALSVPVCWRVIESTSLRQHSPRAFNSEYSSLKQMFSDHLLCARLHSCQGSRLCKPHTVSVTYSSLFFVCLFGFVSDALET